MPGIGALRKQMNSPLEIGLFLMSSRVAGKARIGAAKFHNCEMPMTRFEEGEEEEEQGKDYLPTQLQHGKRRRLSETLLKLVDARESGQR